MVKKFITPCAMCFGPCDVIYLAAARPPSPEYRYCDECWAIADPGQPEQDIDAGIYQDGPPPSIRRVDNLL